MKVVRFLSVCLLGAVSLFVYYKACSPGDTWNNPKSLNSNSNILHLATSADAPPFEFHRTTGWRDEIVGFDIELAQAIAQALGASLNIHDTDFSSLIPMLQSGRADFVMASMSATEERRQNVDFSEPYYTAEIVLLVKHGNDNNLRLIGKRVGVQLGTTHAQFAKGWSQQYEGLELISLGKLASLVEELRISRIDGVLMDKKAAEAFATLSKGAYALLPIQEGRTEYAIAFPKGSPLRARVNQALISLKKKGVLERLIKKWFESPQSAH